MAMMKMMIMMQWRRIYLHINVSFTFCLLYLSFSYLNNKFFFFVVNIIVVLDDYGVVYNVVSDGTVVINVAFVIVVVLDTVVLGDNIVSNFIVILTDVVLNDVVFVIKMDLIMIGIVNKICS